MALDVLVIAFLFAYAWLGAHRGGPESAVRLGGLAFAYAASAAAGFAGGGAAAGALGISSGVGTVLGGLLGFATAQVLVEIVARRTRADAVEPSDASRVLGSALGLARAALLLVPVLWLAGFAESLRAGGYDKTGSLPDFSGSRAAGTGQAAAAAAAGGLAASEDRSTRVTARFMAQPGESMSALAAVTASPHLRVLQSDGAFWNDLASGNVQGALARPTFVDLARDAELRGQLAELGLVAPSSAIDAQQFRDELAVVMADLAPRIAELKNDPGLEELLADEKVRELAQSGDTLALLADPRVREIVERLAR